MWHIFMNNCFIFFLVAICCVPRRLTFSSFKIYTLITLLLTIVYWKKNDFKHEYIKLPLLIYIGIFVRFLSYTVHGEAFRYVFVIIDTIFLASLTFGICKDMALMKSVPYALARTAGVNAIIGIVQAFSGWNLYEALFGNIGDEGAIRFGFNRCYGPYTTPMNFGLFLIFGLSVILFLLFRADKKEKRELRFWYICCTFAAILTVSRAVILSLLVSQTIIFLANGKLLSRIKLKKIFLVFCSLVLIVSVINLAEIRLGFINDIKNSFLAILGEQYVSEEYLDYVGSGDRDDLVSWILEETEGNYTFGLGGDAKFSRYLNRWRTKTSIENTYLATFYHYGIVGLAGDILIYLGIIQYLWKNRKRKELSSGRMSLNNLFLVSYVIYLFAILTFGAMDETRLLYIILGLVMRLNCRSGKTYDTAYLLE